MQNASTGVLPPKSKAQRQKIEEHIFRKLVQDGEAYQCKRLLPSLSQPSIDRADNAMRRIDLSLNKKPRPNPILKYNSLKWMPQVRAREEEVYLSKSKKKFDIKCRRIFKEAPGREVRKSQPAPFSLNKIVAGVKQSTDEVGYLYRQGDSSWDVDLKSRKTTPRKIKEDKLIESRLLVKKMGFESQKEHYLKLSEAITGWYTNQVANDNYF